MKCPECAHEMDLACHVEGHHMWWCPECGTQTYDRLVKVPKGYARMRSALRQIAAPDPHSPGWRQWRARAALDAVGGVGCDSGDPE